MEHNSKTLLLLTLSSICLAFTEPQRHLQSKQLKVGDDWTLPEQSEENLFINRKGIVSATNLGGGKWQIIGLKPGFVVLKTPTTDWKITVSHSSLPLKKKEAPEIPKWLHQHKKLLVSTPPLYLSGSMDESFAYKRLYDWCKEQKGCYFDVELSSKGIKELQQKLYQRLGETAQFEVRPFQLKVKNPVCTDTNTHSHKQLHERYREFYPEKWIEIQCTTTPSYMLESRILVTTDTEAKNLGSRLEDSVSFSINQGIHSSLFARFQNLVDSSKAELVGEPCIHIQQGKKAKVISGGEIQTPYDNTYSTPKYLSEWKSYGLRLEATLEKVHADFVTIHYHLELSEPSQHHARMSKHGISTTLKAPIEGEILAGSTRLSHGSEQNYIHHLFSKVPLIGPLFKSSQKQKQRIYMLTALKVKALHL
ncbi:MAG: hypothetical protein OXT67_09240 [Zetaproteobacteria bacterium]|nr:hypothetical protein [Zetaproteobacteria bacterium]